VFRGNLFRGLRFLIATKLDERWELIRDNIHTASYLLNPSYRGLLIRNSDQRDGMSLIKKLAGDQWSNVEECYLKYREKKIPFDMNTVPKECPKKNVALFKIDK